MERLIMRGRRKTKAIGGGKMREAVFVKKGESLLLFFSIRLFPSFLLILIKFILIKFRSWPFLVKSQLNQHSGTLAKSGNRG